MLENVEPALIPSWPATSIRVQKLTLTDVVGSLRAGWDDFAAYLSNRIQLRPPFAANADPLQVARVTPLTEPRPASRSLT